MGPSEKHMKPSYFSAAVSVVFFHERGDDRGKNQKKKKKEHPGKIGFWTGFRGWCAPPPQPSTLDY